MKNLGILLGAIVALLLCLTYVQASLKKGAKKLRPLPLEYGLELYVTLPLRNETQLDQFLKDVQDVNSPRYGKYLTPDVFTKRFAPTKQEVERVSKDLSRRGLRVTKVSSNRLLLRVIGSVSHINSAFTVTMSEFESDGSPFYAPSENTLDLPEGVLGIFGLDNSSNAMFKHASWSDPVQPTKRHLRRSLEPQFPSGMGPADIRRAYNIPANATGKGQAMALVEFDRFLGKDVKAYLGFFNQSTKLPTTVVTMAQACLKCCVGRIVRGHCVGRYKTCECVNLPKTPKDGQAEVTLDVELTMAMVPNLAKLYVYTAPNTLVGSLMLFNRIAKENKVKVVSTSWGAPESAWGVTFLQSHATVFKQMVAQGMAIIAATGDSGASDDMTGELSVDHPASQPLVTAVGGTSLKVDENGQYVSESAWWDPSTRNGGGGGVSSFFRLPDFQMKLSDAQGNLMSRLYRNIPDVALMADQNNQGYAVYVNGEWGVAGGTSAAAPLWAGFVVLVNEQRKQLKRGALGYLNTPLYTVAQGEQYNELFNDIQDNSTNGFYPAVPGYDLATGFGSMNGQQLLRALVMT